MYSLNYYLSQTPGVRRLYKWNAKKKMAHHQKIEDEKKAQDVKNLRHFERKVFT